MCMLVTEDSYRKVILDNTAQSRQRVFDKVVEYFRDHNKFDGEACFQSDNIHESAACFLSDMADELFTVSYKED